MAGVSRLQYTNEIRLIRVMCSGRIDLDFILRAFMNGHDGVFIGGCKLNECNYVTQGNYDTFGTVLLVRQLMQKFGISPDRLEIQFMNASDGIFLTEAINSFGKKIRSLGPLGVGEGLDITELKDNLTALRKLVPYIRLVERERLRINVKSRDAYEKFFNSQEARGLIEKLIGSKISVSQIVQLLKREPQSTIGIANALGLSPSDISRHINESVKFGLVRYDEGMKKYSAVQA